mmetsp:Transcript_159188/g.290389  ORF Transcript_159188/g.290389 Transcript_159188/m.290389 type:complete len:376 (+) Transcript_159188:89-1216(+)
MPQLRWLLSPLCCFAGVLLLQVAFGEDTPGCSTASETCPNAASTDHAEVSLLQTVLHVQKEQPIRKWTIPQDARLNEVLVVPSLKLIFCFIPKNAGTQFNRLMNALNGLERGKGEICSSDDPNYASAMHGNFTSEDFQEALNSDAWTKATFLRDPLERYISAYQSKCVQPRECGGCMYLENSGDARPRISLVSDRLKGTRNVHFTTQSSFCGGLADNIGAYDYVGHVSDDTEAVQKQVAEMLSLAVKRASRAPAANLQLDASKHSEIAMPRTNSSLASAPAPLAHFGRQIGKKEAEVLELGRQFFPVTGLDAGNSHAHPNTDVESYLKDGWALFYTLEQYADDYDHLPGLKRPEWAHKVKALYDAMPWRPRPGWL